MSAINGFILVSLLDGAPHRHYVGRGPDFIAERLREAIASKQPVFEYWDRPGERDARQIRFACELVTALHVQHLAPDLDALFDQDPTSSYAL